MYDDTLILDFVFPYTRGAEFDRPLEGSASDESSDGADGGEGRQEGEADGRQDSEGVGRQDRPDEADNNEGDPPVGLLETIARGERCCALVPERVVNKKTAKDYKAAFVRMLKTGSLDPFTPGIAFDTYYFRRAALHYGGVIAIRKLIKLVRLAIEQRDDAEVASLSRMLEASVDAIEIAFEREPPGEPNLLPWEGPASRFHEMANKTTLARGANSKKHVLGKLEREWDQQLWSTATKVKFRYLLELAIHLTVPVRPEDMVPGDRATSWSAGIILRLVEPCRLEISFMPSKSHHGRYGTGLTTVTVDPIIADPPAKFLAERCREAGGSMIVSIKSKNAVRKSMTALGKLAFPESDVTITPSVARHQLIADLKKTFGAGEAVAAASGHGTDRTQARYGYLQHGRKRRGYISIVSAKTPRAGNVERARQFSRDKALRPDK
ncbi:hypothetical protein M2189_004699 [Bradyrhizobium japonicum]|jgi:hypothetical protein|uniref:hypothetical protein n=1 Tax=Bradyrhizobium japonicum TaxID=375 RepID=UPI002169D18B|nr:hypothetical protein [Bradyrhizobium japonicum]MCS3496341.1 hypothetical protein [Bradyrhizobium japonicum]MCS3961496.1 hypothetical protein [Bradyrhizobium japonicum]MCS3993812.1 hypothetical protein [Bradyrhizobium japonicum]